MTKPTKWPVHSTKTQISLGICPIWLECSLSAWRNIAPLTTYWAHSKDSDHTGRMPMLICLCWAHIFLLVLSCGGSYHLSVLKLCKFCLNHRLSVRHVTFNMDADQPAYPHSLISICYLLPRQYHSSSFYTPNFKPLASLCNWAGCFESYLIAIPKDRFSSDIWAISWLSQFLYTTKEQISMCTLCSQISTFSAHCLDEIITTAAVYISL